MEVKLIIHAVTDGTGLKKQVITTAASIYPNVEAICIREKQMSPPEIAVKIKDMLKLGIPPKKLIVHSNFSIAIDQNLGGVHFSEFDNQMKAFKRTYPFIQAGKSVHSVQSAKQAEQEGADYLYFGHIFETSSKQGLPGRGLDALREITNAVAIPVIAIGGIHPGNVTTVFETGAAGAAMISAFFKKEE